MRLKMSFSTWGPWESGTRTLQLPMEVVLDPYGGYAVDQWSIAADEVLSTSPSPGHRYLTIVGEREVNPEGMVPREDPAFLMKDEGEGFHPAAAVASPEIGELSEGAGLIFGAVSFAIGIALVFGPHIAPGFPNEFLPDTERDEQLLLEMGRRPRMPLSGRTGTEVFPGGAVDGPFIQELARRQAVRVYPEALHDISATATFRDLWRTLELAFQAEGKELTELLAQFGPAKRLGFDRTELESLRAIRGQISHASSRLGPREVSRSEAAAGSVLGRLWSLVDWVILSKRDASRSLDEDELRPLAAFIRRDGGTEVTALVENPKVWVDSYGWGASSRFHAPDEPA